MSSGQARGRGTKLRRFEFVFQGQSYSFSLNPETYVQNEPGRVNVTQTKAGAYIEAFGAGMLDITMSGVTGFKNGTGDTDNGFNKFKELRDLIKSVYDNVEDGREVTEYLYFYNHTDDEAYITYPDKFELNRNKNQPLLYKYNIHLVVLRRADEPEPNSEPIIVGNPLGIEPTYDATVSEADPVTTTNPLPTPTPTASELLQTASDSLGELINSLPKLPGA